MNEQLNKALNAAQVLSKDLREAACTVDAVTFLLMEQFIRESVSLELRIKNMTDRLALRDGGKQ